MIPTPRGIQILHLVGKKNNFLKVYVKKIDDSGGTG